LTRFEALGDQVAALLQVDEAIIDGEVVVIDETGRPQFYDLLRRAKAPAYVAFDLLWVMVPTCDRCHSASAESGYKRFCRQRRRSSRRRFTLLAAAAALRADVRE